MKYLYQPVTPFVINQTFDQNNACVSTDGNQKVIAHDGNSCPVGYKPLYKDGRHGALDLRSYHGQPVYAAQRGTVYKIDTNPKSGLDVRILSEEGGVKFRHIYEHLLSYMKHEGDYVETGEVIGYADSTGYSSGDHLHFQVEELIDGAWTKVDPLPRMEMIPAQNILKVNQGLKSIKQQLSILLDSVARFLRK